MNNLDIRPIEGQIVRIGVHLEDSSGNALNLTDYVFYGAAKNYATREQVDFVCLADDDRNVYMELPGLKLRASAWQYDLFCRQVITDLEWSIAQGMIHVQSRSDGASESPVSPLGYSVTGLLRGLVTVSLDATVASVAPLIHQLKQDASAAGEAKIASEAAASNAVARAVAAATSSTEAKASATKAVDAQNAAATSARQAAMAATAAGEAKTASEAAASNAFAHASAAASSSTEAKASATKAVDAQNAAATSARQAAMAATTAEEAKNAAAAAADNAGTQSSSAASSSAAAAASAIAAASSAVSAQESAAALIINQEHKAESPNAESGVAVEEARLAGAQAALLGISRGFYEREAKQTSASSYELYGANSEAQSGLLVLSAPPETGSARKAPRYLVVHGNYNDSAFSNQQRMGCWEGEACDATITTTMMRWNPLILGVRKLSMTFPNVTTSTNYCFATNVSSVPVEKKLEDLSLSFPIATALNFSGAGNPGDLKITSYTLRAPMLERVFPINTASRVITKLDVQLPSLRTAAALPFSGNYSRRLEIPEKGIEAYLNSLPDWTQDTTAGYVNALTVAGVPCLEESTLPDLLAMAQEHEVLVESAHPLRLWATAESYAAVVAWAGAHGIEPTSYTPGTAPTFATLPLGWTISYAN